VSFTAAHFSHHIIIAIMTPLLPLIRTNLHLNYTQSGMLLSAFTLTYGVAQLPVGWLLNRVKAQVFVFMGIAGVGITGLLIGFSGSFYLLIIAQIIMGIMGSGYHPTAVYFLSTVVDHSFKGRALGIHTIGGSLSYFISPILAAATASLWGWRGAYISLSIPVIALGIFISLMTAHFSRTLNYSAKQGKPESLAVNAEKTTANTAGSTPAAPSLTETPHTGPPAAGKVNWFRLITVLTLSVIIGAVAGAVIGFIPLYAVDTFGIKESTAASLIAVIFSAGIWASPTAGFLSDRLGQIPLLLFAGLIGGPIIYLLTILPFGFTFYVLMILTGVVIFIRMPVSESFLVGEVNVKLRSTILGIYFFASSLSGGLVTPVMGRIADKINFKTAFRITGIFLFTAVALCMILLLAERKSRENAYKKAGAV